MISLSDSIADLDFSSCPTLRARGTLPLSHFDFN